MAMSSSSRSSGATICALAAADRDFKRCCLRSGRYDGANRNHYFRGVRLGGAGVQNGGDRSEPRFSVPYRRFGLKPPRMPGLPMVERGPR
jgi:hypothetical protein